MDDRSECVEGGSLVPLILPPVWAAWVCLLPVPETSVGPAKHWLPWSRWPAPHWVRKLLGITLVLPTGSLSRGRLDWKAQPEKDQEECPPSRPLQCPGMRVGAPAWIWSEVRGNGGRMWFWVAPSFLPGIKIITFASNFFLYLHIFSLQVIHACCQSTSSSAGV